MTLAFRRWRRPTVRAGGTLLTAVGQLAIERVDRVDGAAITTAAARRAGYESPAAQLSALTGDGHLYRIAFRLQGEDPRVALRADDRLDAAALDDLRRRLDRLDAAAAAPWVRATLTAIARRPGVRAGDLAAAMDRERLAFKRDVRKLKALGLTESLEVGYRLSPRGRRMLKALG